MGKEYRFEFLNRFDEIIIFRLLEWFEVSVIVDFMFVLVFKCVFVCGIMFDFIDLFKLFLYFNGFSFRFGVRLMRWCVWGLLENNFVECMFDGFVFLGDIVNFDYDDD